VVRDVVREPDLRHRAVVELPRHLGMHVADPHEADASAVGRQPGRRREEVEAFPPVAVAESHDEHVLVFHAQPSPQP
jgi:hypothetical protein